MVPLGNLVFCVTKHYHPHSTVLLTSDEVNAPFIEFAVACVYKVQVRRFDCKPASSHLQVQIDLTTEALSQ